MPVGADSVWKFRSSGKIRVCEIIFCAVRPSPSLRPLPLLRGRCSAPESVRLSPRTASTDNSGIRSPTPARPHVRRRTVRPVSTGTPCPMSADLWDNSRPFHCPGRRGVRRHQPWRIAGRGRCSIPPQSFSSTGRGLDWLVTIGRADPDRSRRRGGRWRELRRGSGRPRRTGCRPRRVPSRPRSPHRALGGSRPEASGGPLRAPR